MRRIKVANNILDFEWLLICVTSTLMYWKMLGVSDRDPVLSWIFGMPSGAIGGVVAIIIFSPLFDAAKRIGTWPGFFIGSKQMALCSSHQFWPYGIIFFYLITFLFCIASDLFSIDSAILYLFPILVCVGLFLGTRLQRRGREKGRKKRADQLCRKDP